MTCEILKSEDGAAVLIFKMRRSLRKFYEPAADAFTSAVHERLYEAALRDYATCSDRRKRYRFRAWTAEFVCTDRDNTTELTVCLNGEILRREKHTFDGELLIKRERI